MRQKSLKEVFEYGYGHHGREIITPLSLQTHRSGWKNLIVIIFENSSKMYTWFHSPSLMHFDSILSSYLNFAD